MILAVFSVSGITLVVGQQIPAEICNPVPLDRTVVHLSQRATNVDKPSTNQSQTPPHTWSSNFCLPHFDYSNQKVVQNSEIQRIRIKIEQDGYKKATPTILAA